MIEVLRKFDSGARKLRVEPGVEIGVDQFGKVYWANDGGWDWVLGIGQQRGLIDERPIERRRRDVLSENAMSVDASEFIWKGQGQEA